MVMLLIVWSVCFDAIESVNVPVSDSTDATLLSVMYQIQEKVCNVRRFMQDINMYINYGYLQNRYDCFFVVNKNE